MKVVVLAAGGSSRMMSYAADVPSCLLPFGSETLLSRILSQLANCKVLRDDIAVVVGCGAESIEIPEGVRVVENKRYAETDNAYSLLLAMNSMSCTSEGILVIDANVVMDVSSLEMVLHAQGNAVLAQAASAPLSGTGMLVDSCGRVISIGKHLATEGASFSGVMALDAATCEKLYARLSCGNFDRDWYTVPLNDMLNEISLQLVEPDALAVKVNTDAAYRYAKRAFGVEKLVVLLVGASGFLGQKMMSVMARRFDAIGVSRVGGNGLLKCNPLDPERLRAIFEMVSPDVVINLVGYADPDLCDADQVLAYDLNVRVPETLAALCREKQVNLIQISTDYVFDGDGRVQYETCSPRYPKSYYGHTKKMAEDIAKAVSRSLIVRIPVLYGRNSDADKETFPLKVIRALTTGKRLECDDSQVRYPVLIDDVCEAVSNHVLDTGVLHISSSMPVTKYEWARIVAQEFGLDCSLIVRSHAPVKANRPHHVRLSLDDGGVQARDVIEGTRVLARQQACSFEPVYKQKPLAYFEGVRVADFRIGLGRSLAEQLACEMPQDIDYVIPIPESGLYYAMGFSEASGIPYMQALVKRNAEKRSFQICSYGERAGILKGNIAPIGELLQGKRVALIDEAIFTGVTIRTVCDAVKACGVRSVDVFIPTPPCTMQCPYGVQPRRTMIAEEIPVKELSAYFRIRSVRFGGKEAFRRAIERGCTAVCAECFLAEGR